VLCTH